MFFFRLVSFIFGSVGILVRGSNLEKFLNMVVSRGIYLWDIKRAGESEIIVKCRLSAVAPLRHIARHTKSSFVFQDREGLPFLLKRLRKRKFLFIGTLFFLAGLYVLSSFIWFIDIKGNQTVPVEQIMEAAEKAGLRFGSVKFRVNQETVEKTIRDQIPKISYVGVSISGTRASIEIAEKIILSKPVTEPANVVSRKSGLVREVLVLTGTPVVKEGDTVVPGQILISGVVAPPQQEPTANSSQAPAPPDRQTYVHARGLVRASVWYDGYAEVPLQEDQEVRTGRFVSSVRIKTGGREIILKGGKKITFAAFETERKVIKAPVWRNFSIPVEVVSEKYFELETVKVQRTRPEAIQLARQKALQAATRGIEAEANARIVKENTSEVGVKTPENLVRVKCSIETLEDIGVEKTIK